MLRPIPIVVASTPLTLRYDLFAVHLRVATIEIVRVHSHGQVVAMFDVATVFANRVFCDIRHPHSYPKSLSTARHILYARRSTIRSPFLILA